MNFSGILLTAVNQPDFSGAIVGILITGIIVCVLILIMALSNKKNETPPTYYTPPTPPPKMAPEKPVAKPEAPVQRNPGFVTIYQYIPREPTWICPHCDGENRPGAGNCRVCGRGLR